MRYLLFNSIATLLRWLNVIEYLIQLLKILAGNRPDNDELKEV